MSCLTVWPTKPMSKTKQLYFGVTKCGVLIILQCLDGALDLDSVFPFLYSNSSTWTDISDINWCFTSLRSSNEKLCLNVQLLFCYSMLLTHVPNGHYCQTQEFSCSILHANEKIFLQNNSAYVWSLVLHLFYFKLRVLLEFFYSNCQESLNLSLSLMTF